jgi:uncharacterized membrane protein
MMRYHYGRFGHPYAWGVFHWVVLLLLLAALVALVVLLLNRTRHPVAMPPGPGAPLQPPAAPSPDAALAHARLRYARGEMSRDEYLQVAADLGGDAALPPPPAPPPASPPPPA